MQEVLIFVGAGLALFLAGVALSQKVKDWLAGVPSELRTELNALEASVKGQVKSAQAAVVADVKSKVVIQTPVLQTSQVALQPVVQVAAEPVKV